MYDILIVHSGAGNQSLLNRSKYKKLLKNALLSGSMIEASKVLEGSSLTNTGIGSSLNLLGKVQCDSSFIIRNNARAVEMGAMFNIRHPFPILENIRISSQFRDVYQGNALGLSRPVLVDHQQVCHASEASEANLVTDKNQKIYDMYKRQGLSNVDPTLAHLLKLHEPVTDTIGVIHITPESTSIAASSGGNFFKFPGRIGCAGIIGSSIYSKVVGSKGVSCMCSGNGEDIIMMQLAKSVTERIARANEEEEELPELLVDTIQDEGASIPISTDSGQLYVGVICTIHDLVNNKTKLIYCHSTPSFFFGFYRKSSEPEIILSTLESRNNGIFCRGEFKI